MEAGDDVKNYGETFLKLTPRLILLDWFTPTTHFELDKEDEDLDSSGATLIPSKASIRAESLQNILREGDALRSVGTQWDPPKGATPS